MHISVVICTYNRSAILRNALASLARVRAPATVSWDTYVVDNNSTDGTRSTVESYPHALGIAPPRYVFEPKQGVAHARNAGVLAAQGDVIAFIDDDIQVDENWLLALERNFLTDSDLAVLGGKIHADDTIVFPDWMTGIKVAPLGLIDYGAQRRQLEHPYLATGNCAFRKAAIVSAGLFDVNRGRRGYKLYSDEDVELVHRVMRTGGKVIYDPAFSATHLIPAERITKAYFKRWYHEKGEGVGRVGIDSKRSLFGIALFEYRHALASACRLAWKSLLRKPTFQEELYVLHFFGIVVGRLRSDAGRTESAD